MKFKDRQGCFLGEDNGQDVFLRRLYKSGFGRCLLKILVRPSVSKAAGWFMNRRVSVIAIKPFMKANGISLDDFEKTHFSSYNDFFTRKIKDGARPVETEPDTLISPCDSKLMAYPIDSRMKVTVKGTEYTMESLTQSEELADMFKDGILLLFRLTVDDYHRYCYIDDGQKGENVRIPGVFHTVNPIAAESYPIYKENTRELSLLDSKNFGKILMMEVGALMVGRIVNLHGAEAVRRGEEKGYFEFGGSTIIICLEKDRVSIDEDILKNSRENIETRVRYGERIGKKRS